MNRREALKSGGGVLGILLTGFAATASAAPTAASDREKVEAIENYLRLNHKARDIAERVSRRTYPKADRAREKALAEGEAKGLNGPELEAYAHNAWVAVYDRAYAPYRAEADAAWEASYRARLAVAKLFGQDDMF